MKIIKRSGEEAVFDREKILAAITKANQEVTEDKRLTEEQIRSLELEVEANCKNLTRAASVEEIQDLVENGLMESGKHEVARKYITYRYQHDGDRSCQTAAGDGTKKSDHFYHKWK